MILQATIPSSGITKFCDADDKANVGIDATTTIKKESYFIEEIHQSNVEHSSLSDAYDVSDTWIYEHHNTIT